MVKIIIRNSKYRLEFVSVQEDPTPGSWGDYQLLLQEYRSISEPNWPDADQVIFNHNFLKDKELKHGPLWCVYCGIKDLIIYHWSDRSSKKNMATVDHFYPKSIHPHLAMDKANLRVACKKCNNKKGSNLWKEKFPYK